MSTAAYEMYQNDTDRDLVFYGGRDSGKTIGCSQIVTLRCISRHAYKVVPMRPYKTSASDSALAEIRARIDELPACYRGTINAPEKSTEINFKRSKSSVKVIGIERTKNAIRSVPGVKLIWPEEAQDFTGEQVRTFRPTVYRNEGGQILWSFNPDEEQDWVYQNFVVNPLPSAAIRKINYDENLWLSETSKAEIESMKDSPYFAHVYLGELLQEGSMFYPQRMIRMDKSGLKYWDEGVKIRSWDTAYTTKETSDFTAGGLLIKGMDQRILLKDLIHDRIDSSVLYDLIISTAIADGRDVMVRIECVGGSEVWIDNLERDLGKRGIRVVKDKPKGRTKAERAISAATVVNSFNFVVPEDAEWITKVSNEMSAFPSKKSHDDIIDMIAYGVNYLLDYDDTTPTITVAKKRRK